MATRCTAPAAVPRFRAGHWKTTTFVRALRFEGMTAPMMLDGAVYGVAFLTYVEQVLVPTLKPGETSSSWTIYPPTSPGNHRSDGSQAGHALTFKLDHSKGADHRHSGSAGAHIGCRTVPGHPIQPGSVSSGHTPPSVNSVFPRFSPWPEMVVAVCRSAAGFSRTDRGTLQPPPFGN